MSAPLPGADPVLSVVALAFAAGADLFWVVQLLCVATWVPWLPDAPGVLAEASLPSVVAFAALLHGVERAAESLPPVGLFWHAGQVVARPVAGALLGVAIVPGPTVAAVLAAGVGGVVATASHRAQWGRDLHGWLTEASSPRALRAAAIEDGAVAALVIVTLAAPAVGGAVALVGLGALVIGGRQRLDLARFGLHLVAGRIRGLLGRGGWRPAGRLPEWARAALPGAPGEPGRASVAVPAGSLSTGERGVFRSGWVVSRPDGAYLVVREREGTTALPLHPDGEGEARAAFDRIPARAGDGSGVLHVAKDGPGRAALRGRLDRA